MFKPSIDSFLGDFGREPLRTAWSALLNRLLKVAYSLVFVYPLWDTHAGREC